MTLMVMLAVKNDWNQKFTLYSIHVMPSEAIEFWKIAKDFLTTHDNYELLRNLCR